MEPIRKLKEPVTTTMWWYLLLTLNLWLGVANMVLDWLGRLLG